MMNGLDNDILVVGSLRQTSTVLLICGETSNDTVVTNNRVRIVALPWVIVDHVDTTK